MSFIYVIISKIMNWCCFNRSLLESCFFKRTSKVLIKNNPDLLACKFVKRTMSAKGLPNLRRWLACM